MAANVYQYLRNDKGDGRNWNLKRTKERVPRPLRHLPKAFQTSRHQLPLPLCKLKYLQVKSNVENEKSELPPAAANDKVRGSRVTNTLHHLLEIDVKFISTASYSN